MPIARLLAAAAALTVAAACADAQPSAAAAPRPHTAGASVQVVAESLPMPQLGRTRRIWVYLPAGYARDTARYPVLYLHDGQNLFDAATSYAGEWGVDETLDSLARAGDRGAIVVGIDNAGERRMDEYNPWKAADPRQGGGEGEAYVRWVVETLKPWIDARYRTLTGPAHTTVGGSSMGGLISLYATLTRPATFGNGLVFSNSTWIARDSVLALARGAVAKGTRARLYFVVGHEDPAGEMARDQALLVAALRGGRVEVQAREVPEGRHNEAFWRGEFARAYGWVVGGVR